MQIAKAMLRALAQAAAAVAVVTVGALVASAQTTTTTTAPADPTNGAFGNGVSGVQSFVTGTAAGPLFLLCAAVVGIMIGLRWLKKTKTAAT